MSATLSIRPMPEIGQHIRELVVDCPHGTTTVHAFDTAQVTVPAPALVVLALSEHDRSEGCGCTARLWRKYGASR